MGQPTGISPPEELPPDDDPLPEEPLEDPLDEDVEPDPDDELEAPEDEPELPDPLELEPPELLDPEVETCQLLLMHSAVRKPLSP